MTVTPMVLRDSAQSLKPEGKPVIGHIDLMAVNPPAEKKPETPVQPKQPPKAMPEPEQTPSFLPESKKPMRLIGTAFNTYILVE